MRVPSVAQTESLRFAKILIQVKYSKDQKSNVEQSQLAKCRLGKLHVDILPHHVSGRSHVATVVTIRKKNCFARRAVRGATVVICLPIFKNDPDNNQKISFLKVFAKLTELW